MSKLQKFKALKPCPDYKVRRHHRELIAKAREYAEFHRDCDVAYAAMVRGVTAHNVAVGTYAARASPAVH